MPAGEVIAGPLEGADGAAGIWRVVLRHPGRLNAMSRIMWQQLRAVFCALQQHEPGVRCVIVQGDGGAFCAGGDISEYPGFRFDPAQLRAFHEGDVWGGLAAMLACDVPLVAGIDGACMGAGVEIASCCDLRIATPQARFGAPIARLGFPMAPREAQLVASAAGAMTARQMLLEAATFSAAEMAQRGFLSRIEPAETLETELLATARRIAALAPQAARLNKQTLRALLLPGLVADSMPDRPLAPALSGPDAMKKEADALADPYAYADSAEHREGIGAFLEKRPPRF
ncbi:enoyl-CoA hydratase/isomerase family protein [Acidovorax sp. Leaf160]|uniref:enoyl-CoA hydratase/isomerase family protein n=1 Tax=Acidovorax sp. Leaf160 TaxID=1736280 RepID=UPI0007011DF1|nr:enoyl-CoA hydratase/isomerase family protein [Acidovorax sp. Leaf160]KQR45927.1 enoyl-CoA hydratase [Acidovorax sp. Leaf160]